jgi:glutathione S-transferase
MLELYHHGSSVCAAKVRLALAEKQLEWNSHYVDILRGEQFAASFLAVNPKAVVPVLIHDGAVITESTIICEYLEDAFPKPALYPQTPLERAAARQWTKAVDEELHPACSALTYIVSHRHTILCAGIGSFEAFIAAGGDEGRAARLRKWQWINEGFAAPGAADFIRLYCSYLEKMEQTLQQSKWLIGDTATIADIAMAPYVNRLSCLGMHALWTNGRLPNVEAWFDRMRARPAFVSAVVEWLPPELAHEMLTNGRKSWPEVARIAGVEGTAQSE